MFALVVRTIPCRTSRLATTSTKSFMVGKYKFMDLVSLHAAETPRSQQRWCQIRSCAERGLDSIYEISITITWSLPA
jgi:hypothetical protein